MNRIRNVITVISQLFSMPYVFPKGVFHHPFLRFLNWQVFKLTGRNDLIFELPGGNKMILRKGQQNASAYYYYGFPDFNEQKYIVDHIKHGDLFVDVGANAGGWTLIASGYGANVVAFEPVQTTFDYLSENCSLNSRPGISIFKVAIGDAQGEVLISNDSGPKNKIVDDGDSQKSEKVALTTLDEILGDQSPAFIKIDTEGYELNVLKGAQRILKMDSLKALIIEDWRGWRKDPMESEIDVLLASYHFFPSSYCLNSGKVSRLKKGQEGLNTLFTKMKGDY
jgi:FkbM family methyltransferase